MLGVKPQHRGKQFVEVNLCHQVKKILDVLLKEDIRANMNESLDHEMERHKTKLRERLSGLL